MTIVRFGAVAWLAASLLAKSSLASGVIPIQEVFSPAGQWDPGVYGKVAVVAWNSSASTPLGVSVADAERFKQSNRETLAAFIRTAAGQGAKLIVTPEFSVVGYPYHPQLPPEQDNFLNREEVAPYVETVPGPSTEFFGKLALELGVYIHAGLAEVDPKDQRYYNTVIAVGPEGQFLGKYRKFHLYQVESRFLSPGSETFSYTGLFGRVGLVICSDIYSSFPMNNYKADGVNVLALSTSWAQYNSGMSAFQSGARWVSAYVMAANQMYFPDSGVINPDGSTQSHIRQTSGIAYGFLPYQTPRVRKK